MRKLRLRAQITWIRFMIHVALWRIQLAMLSLDVQHALIRSAPFLTTWQKRNATRLTEESVLADLKQATAPIIAKAHAIDAIERELHALA